MNEVDEIFGNAADDFLNSLGVPQASPTSNEQIETQAVVPVHTETVEIPQEEPATRELSESDIEEVLSEVGFTETLDAQYEDITDDDADLPDWENNGNPDLELEDNDEEYVHHYGREEEESEEEVNTSNEENTTEESSFDPLPQNSPTLTLDDRTSRFSGAEWFNEIQKSQIILAGLGGIGSWTALLLGRMNPECLALYDDDVVERANMSGQLYGNNSINRPKVNAMLSLLQEYTICSHIYAVNDRFSYNTEAGDIMICGFDNMEAREIFFNAWYNHVASLPEKERKNCLFIDGRLSINILQVFSIRGDDEWNIKRYKEEFLFDSSEAEETVCSLKQTSYLANMIGSIIVNLFTNFTANKLNPAIEYTLPFFTEYNSQFVLFKTEF